MSDTNEPNVDEIKDRLKIDIPIEDEDDAGTESAEGTDSAENDILDELNKMGQQFADALQSAWNSEERARFETEIKEGVRIFADEVEKAIQGVKDGNTGQKLREDAEEMRQKMNAEEVGEKARTSFVSGLRWLSTEMGKLADQFTPEPKEKSPEDVA
ncbi:MAG: hypothetical protein ACPG8W_08785 [Candidatus Promineifilaceae bacterium]